MRVDRIAARQLNRLVARGVYPSKNGGLSHATQDLFGGTGSGGLRRQRPPPEFDLRPGRLDDPHYDAEQGLLDHDSSHDGPVFLPPPRSPGVWRQTSRNPLSTFAVDVDTASYSLVRGYLNRGQLPPPEAVRLEEMVNYFPYDYARPHDPEPLALDLELAECPWNARQWLLRVAIQAQSLPTHRLPPRNLVFLIDVSGSMAGPQRMGLIQKSLQTLVQDLTERDRVAIVTYAGDSGIVLRPTADKGQILEALTSLTSGGSTNGEAGIREAYQLAAENFQPDGINRVILATDGDFNVGLQDHAQLVRWIEEKRQTGIFLTTLGVGQENIHDSTLEQLADQGNGNYAFLDSPSEADKVLVREAGGTLVTLAREVKIQVEFNPKAVSQYRLLGYDNRALADSDFNDDLKDAGEVGSGHRVTALYLLQPLAPAGELAHVKVRYQPPQGGTSKLLSAVVTCDRLRQASQASEDFRFAAAVSQFSLILQGQPGSGQLPQVLELARSSRGQDPEGYRGEFLKLVARAQSLRQPLAGFTIPQ